MTRYLLDTNILLCAADPTVSGHPLATDAVATLLARGDECCITAQVFVEFWSVATARRM